MSGSPVPVAVNLLWCVPGAVGGSEEYLVRQLVGLAAIESAVVPTLYVLPGFAAAHPELAAVFRMVEAKVDGANRARRVLAEHMWLARETSGSRLVHHGGGTLPGKPAKGSATVLTIHDLQYRTFPQYLSNNKRRYLQWTMPRSAKRATVIATPTEYVRQTVIEAYAIDPDRVMVVPHGIEPTLGHRATGEAELREKYALGDGPVLVLPAMTHPHKGHQFLLDVMATHWTDPALRLVLIGGAGSHEGAVMRSIEALGLGDRVLRPGRVSAEDRDGLLSLAMAMVFPSEYEGFGAPVIEAMVLGVPVICSDRTCLPEVAGDAAIVVPLELDAWAGVLDEARWRRSELSRAGRARATRFTSVTSAEALLDVYARALG
ncbi:MAG: glycosyltransferase family 1 protein [Ilumatobacteraceae bacterium]